MFIGHLGAGLALKKFDQKTNLAWYFVAVLLPDLLLWFFILLGIERVIVPPDFYKLHYLKFFFPYSHSLIGTIAWSLLTYVIAEISTKRKKTAVLLALGVFSHYIFDFIVHTPDLTIAGDNSLAIGLGLWDHIYLAISVEIIFFLIGLVLYIDSTKSISMTGKYGIYILAALLIAAAFVSQVLSPRPEYGNEVAGSALLSVVLVILTAYWLDRKRLPEK
jgi:hypothetical protein